MSWGTETLSPDSYLQNSNWLFQENCGSKWTAEENKQFEKALALYDTDTPDRWLKVAAMIPGKTVDDVKKQYKELEDDVSDIEAGLIPIPGYTNTNSFTLEWVDNQGYEQLTEYYSPGKRGTATRPSDQERKKGVPWSEAEHRTPTQVASHAQKYFIRQLTGGKDKRRSSIHDITTVNLQETKSLSPEKNSPPSPSHSATTMQPQLQPKIFSIDWNPPSEGVATVFDLEIGNVLMPPTCGISTYGPKLQDQNLHRGTHPGYQFGSFN
ncbi:transcription factor DIVARICATA-like isoform X2 [Tripterygium wilfordii]|uniref:transcription factor DIVARICATA-like isoform X2 n=1 Tax=Tripterygium wilfordii TaxID=458696 RepID=UPI0018F853C7|nr:transcription factor DIVARICATA-like isoform X2 [Tripterygium wilfordii]